MSPRSPLTPLLVVALTVAGLLAVDLATPEPAPEVAAGEVPGGGDPRSGLWVCAAGDGREGTELRLDAVRPDETGDVPSAIELELQSQGQANRVTVPRLFPGAATRLSLEADATNATVARWYDAPALVARSWRFDGSGDLPPGTVAGPCASSTATTSWVIPGLTTAGGGEARLHLSNPHPTGATVAIRFLTPDGLESPTVLRNVSVPTRGSVEIPVNDHLPERPDLAATVTVLSGRVAVEGVQLTRSAIGGIDGVSLLAAAQEPSETWTVPWAIDGPGRSSWLWVANTSDRSAPVELSLHTVEGGVVPDGLAEVAIPPGTVRRVDLRGTFPEDATTAGVTVRSNGVPVVVSAVAQRGGDDPDATGFSVQLGAPDTDHIWVVSGGPVQGRTERLRLLNPGSEPAVVDLSVWDGATVKRPADLAGVEVPAGSLVAVELTEHLGGADAWAVTAHASSGELVVGHVGTGDPDGPLHLVAGVGAPSSSWSAPQDGLVAVLTRGLVQRLGTALGFRPRDRFAPEDGDDAPPGGTQDDADDAELQPDAPAPAPDDDAGTDGPPPDTTGDEPAPG